MSGIVKLYLGPTRPVCNGTRSPVGTGLKEHTEIAEEIIKVFDLIERDHQSGQVPIV